MINRQMDTTWVNGNPTTIVNYKGMRHDNYRYNEFVIINMCLTISKLMQVTIQNPEQNHKK